MGPGLSGQLKVRQSGLGEESEEEKGDEGLGWI